MSNEQIPQPLTTIGCQDLLVGGCIHCGWLRKRSDNSVFMKVAKRGILSWPHKFVVVKDGCIYVYRHESNRSPQGAFTLYGYNSVNRATDVLRTEAEWPFKLIHAKADGKTYYFSASSEVEQKKWMKIIKHEMYNANSQIIGSRSSRMPLPDLPRSAADGQEDTISLAFSEIEEKIYDDIDATKMLEADKMQNFMEDDVEADYDDIQESKQSNNSSDYRSRGPIPLPTEDKTPPILPVKGPPPDLPNTGGKPKPLKPKKIGRSVIADELNQALRNRSKLPHDDRPPQTLPRPDLQPKPPKVTPRPDLPNKPKAGGKTLTPQPPSSQVYKSGTFSGRLSSPAVASKLPHNSTLPNCSRESPPRVPMQVKEPQLGTPEYWKAADWDSPNKEEASRVLKDIGEDGVFLLRGSDGCQTLVLLHNQAIRKYKINYHPEAQQYYIVNNEMFDSVDNLLQHYHHYQLPTVPALLHKPYKLVKPKW